MENIKFPIYGSAMDYDWTDIDDVPMCNISGNNHVTLRTWSGSSFRSTGLTALRQRHLLFFWINRFPFKMPEWFRCLIMQSEVNWQHMFYFQEHNYHHLLHRLKKNVILHSTLLIQPVLVHSNFYLVGSIKLHLSENPCSHIYLVLLQSLEPMCIVMGENFNTNTWINRANTWNRKTDFMVAYLKWLISRAMDRGCVDSVKGIGGENWIRVTLQRSIIHQCFWERNDSIPTLPPVMGY